MASAEQIAQLRRLISEPSVTDDYTDERLGALLDATGATVKGVAAEIWREKAASYAGMIDVSEGSSTRPLSQLHKQALAMASALAPVGDTDSSAGTTRRRAGTRQIERP